MARSHAELDSSSRDTLLSSSTASGGEQATSTSSLTSGDPTRLEVHGAYLRFYRNTRVRHPPL